MKKIFFFKNMNKIMKKDKMKKKKKKKKLFDKRMCESYTKKMSRLVLSNIDNRSRWQEKEKKTFGT
jgi:hypothetical protein